MTAPLKKINILIVDDETDLREALVFDFSRMKCTIFEASNGQEALEIVNNNPVDIVISDVKMPHLTGTELLKKIREIKPDIPVVMLATGFSDLTESEALKLGAFALMEKPINRKKMFQLYEQALLLLNDS